MQPDSYFDIIVPSEFNITLASSSKFTSESPAFPVNQAG